MRILLDTNVVLDVALAREPFCQAAEMILDASDFRRIHLFITASSATDLYYVLRKEKGRDIGLRFIRRLLEGVDACGVDKNTLIAAVNSAFLDFEDAVQNAAAVAQPSRDHCDPQQSGLSQFAVGGDVSRGICCCTLGMIITIDGPAGAGKSTVAHALRGGWGFAFSTRGRCIERWRWRRCGVGWIGMRPTIWPGLRETSTSARSASESC